MKEKNHLTHQGRDWYSDRYEAIKVERNRYFVLLLVSLFALILAIIALVFLTPLKTAVPYVIQIDNKTGISTVIKPADRKSLAQDEAVTVYFLYKYLNARVGYNYGLRLENARIVRALSNNETFQEYAKKMDVNNPDSPIRHYGENASVNVKIVNYSFPYPNIAQIHFYIEPNYSLATVHTPAIRQYKLATIKFTYANAPLPTEDRESINPLGFFVTSFQLNDEAPEGVVR